MGFKFNPFTNKLDMTGVWSSKVNPQTWTVSPEWVVDSRKSWDFYVDTALWLTYTNPNASWNTWRQVIQSQPA